MPVKVNIWRNHKFLRSAYHPGHASLLMSPVNESTGAVITDVYASWWPGEATAKQQRGHHEPIKNSFSSIAPERGRVFWRDAFREMSDETRHQLDMGHFTPRAGQRQIHEPVSRGQQLLGLEGRQVWV